MARTSPTDTVSNFHGPRKILHERVAAGRQVIDVAAIIGAQHGKDDLLLPERKIVADLRDVDVMGSQIIFGQLQGKGGVGLALKIFCRFGHSASPRRMTLESIKLFSPNR